MPKSGAPAGKVQLSELIDYVAGQLREVQARHRASDDEPVMQFTEAEIELGVSIEKGATGGIRVWVIELGGGRTKADTTTLTVKFTSVGQGVVALLQAPADAEQIARQQPLRPRSRPRR